MLAQAGGQGEVSNQFLESCSVGSGGEHTQLRRTDLWNWRGSASARERCRAMAAPKEISLP